jgi:hypothetical protein
MRYEMKSFQVTNPSLQSDRFTSVKLVKRLPRHIHSHKHHVELFVGELDFAHRFQDLSQHGGVESLSALLGEYVIEDLDIELVQTFVELHMRVFFVIQGFAQSRALAPATLNRLTCFSGHDSTGD